MGGILVLKLSLNWVDKNWAFNASVSATEPLDLRVGIQLLLPLIICLTSFLLICRCQMAAYINFCCKSFMELRNESWRVSQGRHS